MRLRRTLALAAAVLLPLTVGLTDATAVASAPAPVVQEADGDSDDTDTGTLTNPTPATIATPSAAGFGPLSSPDFNNCKLWIWAWAETCFQWVGDNQWIRDTDPNTWAAAVHVQTNYGKERACKAGPAADGWGYCNYDHREGKCVRWRVYEIKGGETRNFSQWSAWYGTEYGSPC